MRRRRIKHPAAATVHHRAWHSEALYRYSERLIWNAPANPFSNLVAELRASRTPLLDLTLSNPTEALGDYPHAEISAALGTINRFNYQPEPFGSLQARTAIVSSMQRRVPGLRLSPSHVALTASTSEAYGILFKLLANPGDEILVPTPSYPLFGFLAELEGVRVIPYRLMYDGSWFIDFESLEAAITSRTRAIVLVNPNNPTGSYLKSNELEKLLHLGIARSLPLISDEVFMDYAFEQSPNRVPTLAAIDGVLSFALNGLSKAAAMPQMKLGWICVNGPAQDREQACARLELILDTYLSVGAPVQFAAENLIEIGDEIQNRIRLRTRHNLTALNRMLLDSPLHPLHTEGGWSALLRVPNVLAEEQWITRLLREENVIVQPGYFFDMPHEAFLVVSLLTEESQFAEGIKRLLTFATRL